MSEALPVTYLAKHGETAWSPSGQHTGRTDLPLTERDERNARALGARLRGLIFAKVLTSPLQRAARTWPALAPWLKSTPIWSNGTTANTKAAARPTSTRSARIGNCSATAVREENRRTRSVGGLIAWWAGCARSKATCWFFRTGIFCGCLPPAGSVTTRQAGGTSY
jgi:hypothetical protein